MFQWENKWNGSFQRKFSGKKVIPSKVLLFSRFDRFDRNFPYPLFALLVLGSSARAPNIASLSYGNVIHVYTCGQTCCFSFTLLADFLAYNCEITGKSDGCFRTKLQVLFQLLRVFELKSCSPSETLAAMFVCTQTFSTFEKDSQMVQFISFPFSTGAERPVPFVEKLLPKIPFKFCARVNQCHFGGKTR